MSKDTWSLNQAPALLLPKEMLGCDPSHYHAVELPFVVYITARISR